MERTTYDAVSQRTHSLRGMLAEKRKQRDVLASQVESAQDRLRDAELVSVVFQELTQRSQQELKERLEKIITYSLSRVFGRDLRFVVEFKSSRKNTVVVFRLASEETGWEPVELTEARGGGVCEIVGFIIRLVFLLYLKNSQRQILFLDEPFSWVSAQYIDGLMDLIRELATKTGIQFIIVTHNEALAAIGDRQYRFSLRQGKTVVQDLLGERGE